MDTLIQLKQGEFFFDIKEKDVKLNNKPFGKDFNMLFEIADWFEKDLADNNILETSILKATLIVDFKSTVFDGKPKSRTKKIIEINLKMKSSILTDEKKYFAEKEKIMEYHYIEKK